METRNRKEEERRAAFVASVGEEGVLNRLETEIEIRYSHELKTKRDKTQKGLSNSTIPFRDRRAMDYAFMGAVVWLGD